MKPKPFIPAWLDDAGLSAAEMRVFVHLLRSADNSTGIAWPSYQRMTQVSGLGKSTVRRCLEGLEGRSLIAKVGKPFGGSCRYRVLPIVPPQGQMEDANSSTTGTIEFAPIVPPQDCNSPSDGTSIVPPQGQEGNPRKVIQGRVSKEELFSAEELLPFPSPEFKQAWDLWKAHLDEKPKSKRPTKTALKLQLKKLAALEEDRAIADLRHSISSNYQAIYPDPNFQPKAGRPSGIEDVYTYAAESNAQRKHADAFFDRSEKEGWKDWRGKPIQDWKAAFREFCEKTIPPDAKPPAPKKFLDD